MNDKNTYYQRNGERLQKRHGTVIIKKVVKNKQSNIMETIKNDRKNKPEINISSNLMKKRL